MTHSSAARAAVEGYTRALAREWAADGIAVLALAAGHFDTESLRKYPEPVWRAAARTVPLQRLGRESEHAWLVALAASPLGRALSGSVDHARRRARQLVRPLAAGVAHRGRRRGADGGAAAARAPLSVAARASASDIPSASSVPSVSQSRSPGIRLTS